MNSKDFFHTRGREPQQQEVELRLREDLEAEWLEQELEGEIDEDEDEDETEEEDVDPCEECYYRSCRRCEHYWDVFETEYDEDHH